jgi:hypothetical protein
MSDRFRVKERSWHLDLGLCLPELPKRSTGVHDCPLSLVSVVTQLDTHAARTVLPKIADTLNWLLTCQARPRRLRIWDGGRLIDKGRLRSFGQ